MHESGRLVADANLFYLKILRVLFGGRARSRPRNIPGAPQNAFRPRRRKLRSRAGTDAPRRTDMPAASRQRYGGLLKAGWWG
jgi:hypothetical protein